LIAPQSVRLFFACNMECFLTIPPIAVASYIFVFKYHERFQDACPPIGTLLNKMIQGAFFSFLFFLFMAILMSFLYRLSGIIFK
jgi:hypothetical protein